MFELATINFDTRFRRVEIIYNNSDLISLIVINSINFFQISDRIDETRKYKFVFISRSFESLFTATF